MATLFRVTLGSGCALSALGAFRLHAYMGLMGMALPLILKP